MKIVTVECRVGFLRKRFESIMKDKSSKLQLLTGTEQFRKRIDKLLSWFLGELFVSICHLLQFGKHAILSVHFI